MKIRKARRKDLNEIAEIFKEEFNKPPYSEGWTKQRARKLIGIYFKKSTILVAEEKGKTAGCVIFTKNYWHDGWHGYIDEIVVSASHQGKGTGSLLLNEAERNLKKSGCVRVELFSMIEQGICEFYDKRKYKIDERFVFWSKKL